MTGTDDERIERITAGIDQHLPYLHKERWAVEHARLREVVRNTTGEERERARQAVQDHYATRDHPETSWEALIKAIGRDPASEMPRPEAQP